MLVGRSFGGLVAPRGTAGEHRLAAMIVDPGARDLGAASMSRLGPLADRVNDPAADPRFDALLDNPAMKALLEPRMVTDGLTSVRAYCADLLRFTNAETVTEITCPAFVTDNETDEVSPARRLRDGSGHGCGRPHPSELWARLRRHGRQRVLSSEASDGVPVRVAAFAPGYAA